jgi:hypothetical protein
MTAAAKAMRITPEDVPLTIDNFATDIGVENYMPVLRNKRHELFAQALVSGRVTATEAYVSAGYSGKGAAVSASRLRRKATVSARIRELQENQAADFMAQLLNRARQPVEGRARPR